MTRTAYARSGRPGRAQGGGDEAELTFALRAVRMGWEIATPYGAHRFDLVIRRGRRWETVQVKKLSAHGPGFLRAKLGAGRKGKGSTFRPYRVGDFDLLAAVHGDRIWLLPWREIEGRATVVLSRNRKSRWELP